MSTPTQSPAQGQGRFLTIVLAACLCLAVAALVVPLFIHRSKTFRTVLNPIPIISIAAAQGQVSFPIQFPTATPAGYRFLGVRVFQIGLFHGSSRAKNAPKPFRYTGLGLIENVPPSGRPLTFTVCGVSPAAQVGLHADEQYEIVGINGHTVYNGDTKHPRQRIDLTHLPTPLHLTVRVPTGDLRTVLIAGRGPCVLGGPPQTSSAPQIPKDKRAALLYGTSGSSFAIVEAAHRASGPSTYAGGSWTSIVKGTKISFYGTKATPDADFHTGGLDIEIANDEGRLTQAQIEQLVRSWR